MTAEPSARVVLLVEDNLADADLVRETMEESEGDRCRFRIVHATRMSDAVDILGPRSYRRRLLDYYLVRNGASPR